MQTYLHENFYWTIVLSYEDYFKYGDCVKTGLTDVCYGFFSTLANPARLAILEQLFDKPMNVTQLANKLAQEQSMISHNLRLLANCRFVSVERKGKKRIYSVNKEIVGALFETVEKHARKYCGNQADCLHAQRFM
jgi:DNA-binding transcriptional ArsR family regulator